MFKSAATPLMTEMVSTIQAANASQREIESRSFENKTVAVTTPVAIVINCFVESDAKSNDCLRHS
jgi:hypothetical protein